MEEVGPAGQILFSVPWLKKVPPPPSTSVPPLSPLHNQFWKMALTNVQNMNNYVIAIVQNMSQCAEQNKCRFN